MPKRKGKATRKKEPARKQASPRRAGKTVPRKPAPKKVAPKAHARKRIDWTRAPAPPKGSKKRADYERSPTYRARQRAAAKALDTRRKREAAEQRRIAREERVAVAKERLGPLLAQVVSDWRTREKWDDTRDSHANWYQEKLKFGNVMRRQDFERVLEELSLEHDLDELGWDIVY